MSEHVCKYHIIKNAWRNSIEKNISYLNSMQFYGPFFTEWTGNKARLNMRCLTSFLDQLNIRQLNKKKSSVTCFIFCLFWQVSINKPRSGKVTHQNESRWSNKSFKQDFPYCNQNLTRNHHLNQPGEGVAHTTRPSPPPNQKFKVILSCTLSQNKCRKGKKRERWLSS